MNYSNYKMNAPTKRPQKRKTSGVGIFLIVLGIVLELYAGGLWGYNQYIQNKAEEAAADALADYQNGGSAYDYFGSITIESANISLPIINGYSNDILNVGACVFDGSIEEGNLIVIGHNYRSVFGRLDLIKIGDTITINHNGTNYGYVVSGVTEIDASDKEQMYEGGGSVWNLTLYTCNFSGAGRITIRAVRSY